MPKAKSSEELGGAGVDDQTLTSPSPPGASRMVGLSTFTYVSSWFAQFETKTLPLSYKAEGFRCAVVSSKVDVEAK